MNKEKFRLNLSGWYKSNKNVFPWRKTKDPYKIFVSEILLRKTTRSQVNDIYSYFIHKYPNPLVLKTSKIKQLEKDLKCLGLYKTRARILKRAGEFITDSLNSTIPSDPSLISKIPGMGYYGTNAVLCFAYDKRATLVDTNVLRLYSRIFNIKLKTKRKHLDKKFWKFAKNMLPEGNVRDFNFALLDFANKVCKSINPKCYSCPMSDFCQFFNASASS